MTNEKVYAMAFADVFPLLLAKAQRKSWTKEEVYQVTAWLTGYTPEQLMRDIRCLDKLIDELAKGKAMDKILRK